METGMTIESQIYKFSVQTVIASLPIIEAEKEKNKKLGWRNGIRATLKMLFPYGIVGSSPTPSTTTICILQFEFEKLHDSIQA
jgi:hypothetical protein